MAAPDFFLLEGIEGQSAPWELSRVLETKTNQKWLTSYYFALMGGELPTEGNTHHVTMGVQSDIRGSSIWSLNRSCQWAQGGAITLLLMGGGLSPSSGYTPGLFSSLAVTESLCTTYFDTVCIFCKVCWWMIVYLVHLKLYPLTIPVLPKPIDLLAIHVKTSQILPKTCEKKII